MSRWHRFWHHTLGFRVLIYSPTGRIYSLQRCHCDRLQNAMSGKQE